MIWQNAWAFAGLVLLALPVLIHLLSRKRAVLQRFPSLRFLDVTRLLPTRSPNISDIPLLLVRLAIVATAVLALAQPLYVTATRQQSLNASLARVVVVDTSRSMARISAGTRTLADSARVLAGQLARDASTSVVLQTANAASALGGASAWLTMQAGRAEIVIVSDFQSGTIDSAAIVGVPAHVGIRAIQIVGTTSLGSDASVTTARTSVTAKTTGARTDAEWTDRNDSDPGITVMPLYAALLDLPDVRAAREAAWRITSPSRSDSLRPVGIVFDAASEHAEFAQRATAPSVAWMASVLVAVRNYALLGSSAAEEVVRDTTLGAPFAVVAFNKSGAPVVYAAQTEVDGVKRLLFFSRGNPSGITSAALLAAVANAVALPLAVSENESFTLPESALKQFERAPQDVTAKANGREQNGTTKAGLSDGRWLWLLVLLLLGVETWMRRTTATRDIALETA